MRAHVLKHCYSGMQLRSITGQQYIVNSKADVQTYFEVLQFQFQNITHHPESMRESWEQCVQCWTPRSVFTMVPVFNASQVNLTFRLVGIPNQQLYWSHGKIMFCILSI